MNDDSTQQAVPLLPDVDPEFPLLYMSVAQHLGFYQFNRRDLEENLRRTKKVFDTYNGLGIPLLAKSNGEPLTSDDITQEMIAHHEGKITGAIIRSTEAFEENLLNTIANRTGVPRLSYRSIQFAGRRPDRPHTVVQEIDDQYRTERRRVELYPDGRLLWALDGDSEGTAEREYTETVDVPGPAIINARYGHCDEEFAVEEFERLWTLANRTQCLWIIAPAETPAADTLCPLDRLRGAFCRMHLDAAARMFPTVFPDA